jgi:hypothetical protein
MRVVSLDKTGGRFELKLATAELWSTPWRDPPTRVRYADNVSLSPTLAAAVRCVAEDDGVDDVLIVIIWNV